MGKILTSLFEENEKDFSTASLSKSKKGGVLFGFPYYLGLILKIFGLE